MMRKIQTLLFALVAVFAFGAVAASSALAADEWLADGVAITTALTADTPGLLNLTTLAFGIKAVELHCVGTFVGTVGPLGKGTITEVLNEAGQKVGALGGVAANCEVVAGFVCQIGSLVELFPENLPWSTEIELMTTAPEFLDHLFGTGGKEPAYEVVCHDSEGKLHENLCEGLTSSSLENSGTTVTGKFGEGAPINSEKSTSCTEAGTEGDVAGEGLTVILEAGVELTTAVS